MSSPVAVLNRIARATSSPNTKRKRRVDDQGQTDQVLKKRAVDKGEMPSLGKRKSVSTLPQVTPRAKTTIQTRRLRTDKWDPESPEKSQGDNAQIRTSDKEKKPMRTVKNRRLISTTQQLTKFSPSKHAPKVTLQSYDTPEKVDRRRRLNPLAKYKKSTLQQSVTAEVEDSDDSGRDSDSDQQEEVPKENRFDCETSVLDLCDEVDNLESQEDHDQRQSNSLDGEVSAEEESKSESAESVSLGHKGKAAQELAEQTVQVTLPPTSESANQMQLVQEERSSDQQNQVEAQSRLNAAQTEQIESTDDSAENSMSENEDLSACDAPPTQPETKKQPSMRAVMTEEEKRARQQAKAQKCRENAQETEAAIQDEFDRLGNKFLRGIEDVVDLIGGKKAWHNLGAAALTIRSQVGRREPTTSRTAALRRTQEKLSQLINNASPSGCREMDKAICELQERSRKAFLMRDGGVNHCSKAVLDVFECLLPTTVSLIENMLRAHFDRQDVRCWKDLKALVEVALSLSNTALDWSPKPSTLETGIRRHVRNNIKANLQTISETVDIELCSLTDRARMARDREELAKAQAKAKAKLERHKEKLRKRLSRDLIIEDVPEQPKRRHEIIDIDEIDDDDYTEPCPEPMWSQKEDQALVGGLERYRGHDRYRQILAACRLLRTKTVSQCMARARFHKKCFARQLTEDAARGEHKFDWLASVTT